jgi:PAS domain S-box-containing protein
MRGAGNGFHGLGCHHFPDRSRRASQMADLTSSRPPVHWVGFEAYLLDQLDVAVVATDLGGTVTQWNRFAETLYGWDREDAIGRTITELLAVVDSEPTPGDSPLTQPEWEGDLHIRARDGKAVLAHVRNSPIRDPQGRVVGVASASVDVAERVRHEQRVEARSKVTRILADARELEEAAPRALEAICRTLEWDLGALWLMNRTSKVLACFAVWHGGSQAERGFEAASRALRLTPGNGLPGRVVEEADALWVDDVLSDPKFKRGREADQAGLCTALAFPILLQGETVGVMEFFSRDHRQRDDSMLDAMSLIGSQIGQFIERRTAERELAGSREQLVAIFQGVGEGITVQGPDGGLLFANEAATGIIGYDSVEALLGAPTEEVMSRFEILDEEGNPFPVDRLPGRRALRGEHPPEEVIRYRVRQTGEDRWSLVSAKPTFDQAGRVRFAVNIFHDITRRKRREDAARVLAEIGPALSSSLDYEETLRRLARLAVPRFADWCAVSVQDEDGWIRQLAVAHKDPAKVRLSEELAERYQPDPNEPVGLPQVIRTATSELFSEVTETALERHELDQSTLSAVRSLGLRSVMIVPLVARNRSFGAMALATAEPGRRYGMEDLELAEDLARRGALHADNARLFTERSRVATALQHSLLPPTLPVIPGLEVAGRYHAAGTGSEVGGDFYDVFSTGQGNWALVIGDVCGKGPEAAGVTGLTRYTIRAAAMQEERPSQVLRTLNEALLEQRSDRLFCTVTYVRVHLQDGKCRTTVTCAGHPQPLLMRSGGPVETVGRPGTLLGVFSDPDLWDRTADLGPGDCMVLYTDGLVEGHSEGTAVGTATLASVLGSRAGLSAPAIADAIEEALLGERTTPPRDDVAMLVLRRQP